MSNGSGSLRETAQLDSHFNHWNAGSDSEFFEDIEWDYGHGSFDLGVSMPPTTPLADSQRTTDAAWSVNVPANADWGGWDESAATLTSFTSGPSQVQGTLIGEVRNDLPANYGVNIEGYALSPTQSTSVSSPLPPINSPKRQHCEICNKSFTKKNDLTRHRKSVHESNDPKNRCACGYEQIRKDNYKRHVRNCKKDNGYYRCKCNKEHVGKQAHLNHVHHCTTGFHGSVGRPKLNDATTL
ncbi:hypothetical protein F4781DRAFT_440067 [Annulohypoxylon bovei var. microspora]|nr:hypothetical protein F4781DRAFT_440067 [Annulohypoxylon bovei var. microspora]